MFVAPSRQRIPPGIQYAACGRRPGSHNFWHLHRIIVRNVSVLLALVFLREIGVLRLWKRFHRPGKRRWYTQRVDRRYDTTSGYIFYTSSLASTGFLKYNFFFFSKYSVISVYIVCNLFQKTGRGRDNLPCCFSCYWKTLKVIDVDTRKES